MCYNRKTVVKTLGAILRHFGAREGMVIHMSDRAQYIDVNDGLNRIRGNKSLYKRMLGMFKDSAEFIAFEEAMQENDLARGSEVAHGIKGMTGNLGLSRVFQLSEQLMLQLREGTRDEALLTEYRQALDLTRTYVDEVMAEL